MSCQNKYTASDGQWSQRYDNYTRINCLPVLSVFNLPPKLTSTRKPVSCFTRLTCIRFILEHMETFVKLSSVALIAALSHFVELMRSDRFIFTYSCDATQRHQKSHKAASSISYILWTSPGSEYFLRMFCNFSLVPKFLYVADERAMKHLCRSLMTRNSNAAESFRRSGLPGRLLVLYQVQLSIFLINACRKLFLRGWRLASDHDYQYHFV